METREFHESYAMVSLSRVTSSHPLTFFGSKIASNSCIELKISSATKERSLSHDNYLSDKSIITIRLSPNQFAEMLTNMNTEGIPATISRFQGKMIEPPPYKSEIAEFKSEISEFEPKAYKLVDDLKSFMNEVKLTKADKSKLQSIVWGIENLVKSNIKFVLKTAIKSLDKGIVEAKATIDSFYTGLITKLGMKTLKDQQKVELLERDNNDE